MAQELREIAGDPTQSGLAFRPRYGAQNRRSGIPQDSISQAALRAVDCLSTPSNSPGRASYSPGYRTAVGHARHPLR